MRVQLQRFGSTDQGTPGMLTVQGFRCYTLEPPWKDNLPNLSCLPPGTYDCVWLESPRFGWTYGLVNVPGRSHLLFHWGNILAHTKGCILVGNRIGSLAGQLAVLLSRVTLRRLFKHLNKQPFTLEVT